MNCAEALVDYLEKRGTPFVAGVPGGTNLPLYDALYKSKIRHVLARHEQGAGFIAQGYARVSGRAGVTFATSGPGALNLVTAIGDAFMDSVPLVAVTGQVITSLAGTDAFQEADITGVAASITKHCYYISDPSQIVAVAHEAFTLAESGRPGPVLIDFPKDMQLAGFTGTPYDFSCGGKSSAGEIARVNEFETDDQLVREAAAMIEAAHRPLIIAGGGSRFGGAPLLAGLSIKNCIPVAASLMAPHIPTPHYIGMPGMHGFADTQHIVESADLIIAAGLRFDDRLTGAIAGFAPRAKIIHIDIDPCEFDKIRAGHLSVRSDIPPFCHALLAHLSKKVRTDWLHKIEQIRAAYPRPELSAGHPAAFLARLAKQLPRDSIVVTDVGQHQMWAAQYMDRSCMAHFLTSGGMGTMGFGLPAAIGASLASPGSKVVLITGDGSLMMNLQELATAVQENSNLTIVVMNNGALGLVRQQQNLFFGSRYSASNLGTCDFAALASAFGIKALRSNIAQMDCVALCRDGLLCADISTPADAQVLPMVAPGAVNTQMIGA